MSSVMTTKEPILWRLSKQDCSFLPHAVGVCSLVQRCSFLTFDPEQLEGMLRL